MPDALPLSSRSRFRVLGCASNSATGPTTSFAVLMGKSGLLIDTGVDPVGRLVTSGEDPTFIDTLVVTHAHSDHCAGFANFVFTRNLLARGEGGIHPLTVHADTTTTLALKSQLATQYPERRLEVRWITVSSGDEVDGPGDSKLQFLASRHEVPALSVKITEPNEGWTVGIQADGSPTPENELFFAGSRVLALETHSLELLEEQLSATHARGHSGLGDAVRLARAVGPDVVIPFHLSKTFFTDPERRKMVETALGYPWASGLRLLPEPW